MDDEELADWTPEFFPGTVVKAPAEREKETLTVR
jgi:hypothetical protein